MSSLKPGVYTEFRMPLINPGCPGGIYWDEWTEPGDITLEDSVHADHVDRQRHRLAGPIERRAATVTANDWKAIAGVGAGGGTV